MRKAPIRLSCPPCLGVALETATLANGAKVGHCRRCGGTWLLRGQIPRLRAIPANALRVMFHRADDAGFLCHGCHAPMDRNAAWCSTCGWNNRMECPDCGKPMRRQSEHGVTVDVCRGCEGVWLDHHELSALWAGAATMAVAQTSNGSSVGFAPDAGDLLEVLFHAPDLAFAAARGVGHVAGAGMELAGRAAGSALEAAAQTPGLLSSLPEATGGALEIVGELAGAVFELIATIIAGIFEGLGSISG
jgi:Zn-finger nucleic acid-binding protein